MFDLIDIYCKLPVAKNRRTRWVWIESTRMHKTCAAACAHFCERTGTHPDSIKARRAHVRGA